MPASIKTQLSTLDRRMRVADMYRRGYSVHEIAVQTGMSERSIYNDLDEIRKLWRKGSAESYEDLKAKELAKIDATEKAAWEGYDASRQQTHGVGAPRFLAIVDRCRSQRIKLMGLDKPEQHVPSDGSITEVVELVVESREALEKLRSITGIAEMTSLLLDVKDSQGNSLSVCSED